MRVAGALLEEVEIAAWLDLDVGEVVAAAAVAVTIALAVLEEAVIAADTVVAEEDEDAVAEEVVRELWPTVSISPMSLVLLQIPSGVP